MHFFQRKAIVVAIIAILALLVCQGIGDYFDVRSIATNHAVPFAWTRWAQVFLTQIAGRLAEGGIVWLILTASPVKPEAEQQAQTEARDSSS